MYVYTYIYICRVVLDSTSAGTWKSHIALEKGEKEKKDDKKVCIYIYICLYLCVYKYTYKCLHV
jgi:hypothetical protein